LFQPHNKFIKFRIYVLAVQEEALLLDSYIDTKNIDSKFNKFIVRLEQLVLWLYEKGKIRKSSYQEIMKTCIGSPVINKKINFEKNIKFIVSFSTLEQLQEHNLIDILIENGFNLLIEKHSANYIRSNVQSIHELARIGNRSKELKNKVSKLNHFISFCIDAPDQMKKQHICSSDAHKELMITPSFYANKNKLFLLSDDRFTQQYYNLSFGTDILLNDLFNSNMIDTRTYSLAFLQLCQWRYRFLLPTEEILYYFVKENQHHLPGNDLNEIIKYFHDSINDKGLFFGVEPTDPPISIGFKLWLETLKIWINLLCKIWESIEDFDKSKIIEFTKQVITQITPPLPDVLQEEAINNILYIEDKIIISQIFQKALTSNNPQKLNPLLNQIFDIV